MDPAIAAAKLAAFARERGKWNDAAKAWVSQQQQTLEVVVFVYICCEVTHSDADVKASRRCHTRCKRPREHASARAHRASAHRNNEPRQLTRKPQKHPTKHPTKQTNTTGVHGRLGQERG
jgi:hypothetical protein